MSLFGKVNEIPFQIGDTVAVHQKIQEGEKSRIQIFEGIVIAINHSGVNRAFTVRKISSGAIGVERVWATNSPSIEKIEVVKSARVKRAKLYYIRNRKGKEAKEV